MTAALHAQAARLSRQEEYQSAVASQMTNLSSQLQSLQNHFFKETTAPKPSLATTSSTPTAPLVGSCSKLAQPEKFSGEPGIM